MVGYTMKEAKEVIDRKLELLAKEKASVIASCPKLVDALTSYESAEFGHVEITPEDKEKSARQHTQIGTVSLIQSGPPTSEYRSQRKPWPLPRRSTGKGWVEPGKAKPN